MALSPALTSDLPILGQGFARAGQPALHHNPTHMQRRILLTALLGLGLSSAFASLPEAQRSSRSGRDRSSDEGRAVGPLETHTAPESAGIAWFGTWDGALEEAKRTGRPILLMSAAPHCRSVPGVW